MQRILVTFDSNETETLIKIKESATLSNVFDALDHLYGFDNIRTLVRERYQGRVEGTSPTNRKVPLGNRAPSHGKQEVAKDTEARVPVGQVNRPLLDKLRRDVDVSKQARAALLDRGFPSKHPKYIAINGRISTLANAIASVEANQPMSKRMTKSLKSTTNLVGEIHQLVSKSTPTSEEIFSPEVTEDSVVTNDDEASCDTTGSAEGTEFSQ
jgi:hypothetical protein